MVAINIGLAVPHTMPVELLGYCAMNILSESGYRDL
jgi:hypothetical protein